MGRLTLVRHGHTPLDAPGPGERLRGWLDIPRDGRGLQEAAETTERLADHPVETICSSDLRRARQTAEALRRRTRVGVAHSMELRPWNLGVLCGQRVSDVVPFLNLPNRHPHLATPKGESFPQFYGHYLRRLTELMNLALATSGCIIAEARV